MELQLPQQLEYPLSQQYDILTEYASPGNTEVAKLTEKNDEGFCNKPIHNCTQRKRKVYPSPAWRRDSTNRLQRKPLRKSTSFESSLNEIRDYDLNESTAMDSLFNSTHINDSSPHWQRIEYECTTQLRKDLMPVQNRKIFNSTMKNGYPGKSMTETNANPEILSNMDQYTSPVIHRRNHTGKLKISNSWIEWTPFWNRDEYSKRLDRRHYISDFFDFSMDLNDY
ncbi:uncharacterized protein LOC111691097 isoform X1 [Lucilia cuprina]|uniref:uncharacterized protein LOC111691097 isoform X1 n=1 Tax=Lucilia cuprina TaxID=7375 RepID=UPI001F065716|nr:uncharacterized protein LOC111691097 isoform X1 [Lucilia cuprina]